MVKKKSQSFIHQGLGSHGIVSIEGKESETRKESQSFIHQGLGSHLSDNWTKSA